MRDVFTLLSALIFAAVIVGLIIIAAKDAIRKVESMSTEEKIEAAKKWLILAVLEAEKIFGGSTGEVKLLYVYDLFIGKFPTLAQLVPFERFKGMVAWAINEMEEMLDTNDKIRGMVDEYQNENGLLPTKTMYDKREEDRLELKPTTERGE